MAFMLNNLLPNLGTGYWSGIYANSGASFVLFRHHSCELAPGPSL